MPEHDSNFRDDSPNPTQTTESSEASREEETESFAELLESSDHQDQHVAARDAKIEGTVVSVGEEWVFVDIGAKTEGAIAREELVDEDGTLTVRPGDRLDAYVVRARDGDVLLSVKMTAAATDQAIEDAYRSGVPVEGLVTGERKGGYTVSIFGQQTFCPYSQIDFPGRGTSADYIDQRLPFRIIEHSEGGRNVVVSRRALLEEEKARQAEELKGRLSVGDIVPGRVTNLTNFGAFVDIGGLEGLIPMSEMAWYRVKEAGDVVNPGDTLDVKILALDWTHDRISLSRKQTLADPWHTATEKYPEEKVFSGKVNKLMTYGAFVELEPGLEGLIHISAMGAGRRLKHPKEMVTEGQNVDVKVLSVDPTARRISLELVPERTEGTDAESIELEPGQVVAGEVDSLQDYGVFVNLPNGKTGLLHISEIQGVRREDFKRRFRVGDSIQVEVLEVASGGDRISLSTKSIETRKESSNLAHYQSTAGDSGSFGTLGDLLKDKIGR